MGCHGSAAGGGCAHETAARAVAAQVFLLQRKAGKIGAGLGKTTGWVHRAALKNKQVERSAG